MVTTMTMVKEFHERFGCETNTRPTFKTTLSLLRLGLLREELRELKEAIAARDRVETLDALTDLQYVLDGAYLALGHEQSRYPSAVVQGSPVVAMEQLLVVMTRSLMNRDHTTTRLTLDHFQLYLDRAYEEQGFSGVKELAFCEVHRSNMTKLGADAVGKVVKGPNYEPPRLEVFV